MAATSMAFVVDASVSAAWLLPDEATPATEAARVGLSAYDAACLELALRRGLPLATLDEALATVMAKAGVPVL